MRMCVLTACLSAHHLPTYCLLKQEAGSGSPGTGEMVASHYVGAGTEPGSSGRATSALNPRITSPVPAPPFHRLRLFVKLTGLFHGGLHGFQSEVPTYCGHHHFLGCVRDTAKPNWCGNGILQAALVMSHASFPALTSVSDQL